MSRLPIRLRLTLAFALAMAVLLTAFGIVVYERFERSLEDSVDQSLRSRATELVGPVERRGRLPEVRSGTFLESEESFVQVLDREGGLIEGTPPADRRSLLTADELGRTRAGPLTISRDDAVEEGDPARLFAIRTGDVVLVVGQAIDDNEEALATLRLLLLIGLPVTLLLASLGAYALAGRALRPVAQALERERGFVADASHELRTPLAVLKTELELALREGRTEAELRDALRSASEETDRLTRLADDLLVLARSDRGTLDLKLERIRVHDLLTQAGRRFGALVGEVEVSAPGDLAIRGDTVRLEQALGNLVANAAEHGRPPIRLYARHRDGSVELHVEDGGAGLPADFSDRAFERFTRADEARTGGGAGLGLAIVDAIARAHGGRAGSSGADVWIALPALIDGSSGAGTTST
jgi:signal transduction histidine kinase